MSPTQTLFLILSATVLLAWIVVLANNSIRRWFAALSTASLAMCFWVMVLALSNMRSFTLYLSTAGMSDPRSLVNAAVGHITALTYGGIIGCAYIVLAAIGVYQMSRKVNAATTKDGI